MTGYQGASAEAIQHHYDVSNDFYALWLDPTRTYSCALWDGDGDTLQAAQERKLDYLIDGARAAGCARVLDVGCGWGGMLRRLIDHHGVRHGVGLTLSDAQADYVRDWADDRYEVRVENWIDHEPDEPYDAIVSVGAFEHFADFGMRRDGRVEQYRRFFDRARDWLALGGRVAVQSIIKGSNVRLDRATTRDMLFIADRIFPESEIPWASELLEAAERRFDVVSLRNDADHYARTCQVWHDTLLERREQAEEIAGAETVGDYLRYLGAFAEHFRRRHVGLSRIVFERV